jgi:hypothetical protein
MYDDEKSPFVKIILKKTTKNISVDQKIQFIQMLHTLNFSHDTEKAALNLYVQHYRAV